MPRTTLYLVRHGEQATNPALDPADPGGPETDCGLTDLGREQAARLGRRLCGTGFGAIHHSALVRAAQTAGILGEHLPGVPAHACDLVRDRTPVPDPAPGAYPARYQDLFDEVPADERDPNATGLARAVAELGAVGERDRTDLVVTHNFVIGWFVRHVLDAPAWRWIGLNQANGGLTIVRWETGRPPALVAFNDVGHL